MVDGFGSEQDEKDGEYQRERVILARIGGYSEEKGDGCLELIYIVNLQK